MNNVILAWMILGLINLVLLYIAQKKKPLEIADKVRYGFIHQIGVMILWFFFGFIIIPFIILNMIRKYLIGKLLRFNNYLQGLLGKLNR